MLAALLKSIKSQMKLFVAVAFIVIIAACSFKSLYNRLDDLIPAYVEGMVSLDDVLEEKVEQRTQVLVSWHRNTQLKQYAVLLRTFQQDMESPLNEQHLLQHMASMESLWHSLVVKVNEEMAELLPLLNSEQRKELFESINEKNEDYYNEYVDIDEDKRVEQYTETLLDSYEKWLGDLTALQRQSVKQAAPAMSSIAAMRLQQRKLWQHSIKQILDSSDSNAIKSERLRLFLDGFKAGAPAGLAEAIEANKQVFARLTVEVFDNSTAEQKAFFIIKTNDYIRIFTELAENR
jgi:hypothetical protein